MAEVICTSCQEVLKVGEEQRAHYKSDRHSYNVKRKLEGLSPIPAGVWEAKLARFAQIRMQAEKGSSHLKKDKQRKRKDTSDTKSVTSNATNNTVGGKSWVHCSEVTDDNIAGSSGEEEKDDASESAIPALETSSSSSSSSFVKLPSNDDIASTESPTGSPEKGGLLTAESIPEEGEEEDGIADRESKPIPENPHLHSLFDKQCFETTEENLKYMESKYSFFLPDRTYCVKTDGLIAFLHDKITNGWTCIQCDREFKSEADCRRHMFSKNHTTIGTEGYTNSGKYSEDRTNDLMAQLDAFYDYSTSYKELNIKDITKRRAGDALAMIEEGPSEIDPKTVKTDDERLEVILSFFDEDQDSKWKFSEAQEFYRFYTDEAEELSFQEYSSFVKECGRGQWDLEALKKFYKISMKKGEDNESNKRLLKEHFARFLDEWWDDEIDEDAQEFENSKTPNGESASSSSDAPAAEKEGEKKQLKSTRMLRRPIVHEVDDEAEFERLAKAYGLKKATIMPNGNLQLPDGSHAVHRDVHFVYKQRGERADLSDIRRQKQTQRALANPILKAMGQQGNKELLDYMVENNCKSAKEAFAMSEMKSQKRLEDAKSGSSSGGVLSKNTRVAYGLMVREDKKAKKEVIIHLRNQAKEYMQVGVKFNKLVAGRGQFTGRSGGV